jgi:hypothetical protein
MYRDYQNLYNEFAKYGFDKNITEDGIVAKLFELYEEKNK